MNSFLVLTIAKFVRKNCILIFTKSKESYKSGAMPNIAFTGLAVKFINR